MTSIHAPIWRYIALSRKGEPYARESYLRRLEAGKEVASLLSSPEFQPIIPFIVYGAERSPPSSYTLLRVPSPVEGILSSLESELSLRVGVESEPPLGRTTAHTITEL
ncbi:MAG: hypothetical protein J7L91_05400 [Candidatus Korarchaeota archaeon]|nr:hypothetical protein [Candidatus Korarchaeota archaeon]